MEQAFKYRFYPTPEQENLLRRTIVTHHDRDINAAKNISMIGKNRSKILKIDCSSDRHALKLLSNY